MARTEWTGGWADLSERLTHGRRMRIVRVGEYGRLESTPEQKFLFAGELIAAHVTAWSLGEVDAVSGPVTEELDALPHDAFDLLRTSALALWTGRADPNATTPTSDDGSSGSASA